MTNNFSILEMDEIERKEQEKINSEFWAINEFYEILHYGENVGWVLFEPKGWKIVFDEEDRFTYAQGKELERMVAKKRGTFAVGQVLCDMHYGLPAESMLGKIPIKTRDHKTMPTNTSNFYQELLEAFGINRMYTNKFAVVIGENRGWYTAVYSYDARYFGSFEFKARD